MAASRCNRQALRSPFGRPVARLGTALRAMLLISGGAISLSLAGCAENQEGGWQPKLEATNAITPTMQAPGDIRYHRSDEPLSLGIEYFGRGAYGTAERYLRDAVEKAPDDRTAWIALAACYDRIGRFELADKAYQMAIRLGGETLQVLNNEGYSYMLRGNLRAARAKFEAALALDPQNPTILNNLQLLAGSDRFIARGSPPVN
jgi:tetratricopeptide (TPR) repeat protein